MDSDTLERLGEMTAAQEGLLVERFCGQFPDKLHNPRIDKLRSLYQLSRLAKGGCIVELGTYHGGGAIALAWGAKASGRCIQVYTVDDFTRRQEWIGTDFFIPEDKGIFLENVAKAGLANSINLIQMEADAAQAWWPTTRRSISLLFWDLGGSRLFGDFVKWHTFIEIGGLFAVHDTGGREFGFDTVKSVAEAAGIWKYEGQMPGFVYLLRRIS